MRISTHRSLLALDPSSSPSRSGRDFGTALVKVEEQTPIRNPEGKFQPFRISDPVTSRNILAAIYDALRLCEAV